VFVSYFHSLGLLDEIAASRIDGKFKIVLTGGVIVFNSWRIEFIARKPPDDESSNS